MAGIRFTAGFKDDLGIEWDFEIYDELHIGGSTPLVVQDYFPEYFQPGDDIMEVLKASKRNLVVANQDATFDTFVDDLIAAEELQFFLNVRKDGASEIDWSGPIIIDVVKWDNASKPRPFSIVASDGIGRLKNVPFDQVTDGGFATQNSCLKYIKTALDYINTAQFWGANDIYFKESIEFVETQLTLGATDSILLKTEFSKTLFIKDFITTNVDDTTRVRRSGINRIVEVQTADQPQSAYTVIESILRLFSSRLMLSEGVWHIQQVRNFRNVTYAVRNIKKDLTVLSATTDSHRQTLGPVRQGFDLGHLANGIYTYKYPLLKAKLETPANFTAAVLKPDTMNLISTTTPVTQTIQLGTIRGGSGSKSLILFSWNNEFRVHDLLAYNVDTTIEIKIICGSNRVKSDAATPGKVEWTTNAADVVTRKLKFNAINPYELITFATPEIPFTEETGCTVEITLTMNRFNTSISLPDFTHYQFFLSQIQIYLTNDQVFESGTILESDNPLKTDNSIILDFGRISLSDTGIITDLNSFTVIDGITPKLSKVWDAGFATDVSLAKTMLLEAMSLQRESVEVIQSVIHGDFAAHKTVFYDSKTYVYNGGSQTINRNQIRGEWFQIKHNVTSIKIDTDLGELPANLDRLPKVLNAGKTDQDKFDDWKDITNGLTKISTDRAGSGSGVTSLSIFASGNALMKDGDTIRLQDPQSQETIKDLELTSDVGSSDTSISFVSIVINDDIPVNTILIHLPKELLTSACIRGTKVQSAEMILAGGLGKKVTVINTATFNVEKDMLFLSSEYSLTGTSTITLPDLSTCWDANLEVGSVWFLKDTDTNASVNNITIDLDDIGSESIIYTNGEESDLVIGVDGLDITLQVISATRVVAY